MIYYYYFMYLAMSYFMDILCEDPLRELLMRRNQSLIGLAKNDIQPVLRLSTTLPLITEPGEIIQFYINTL